MDRSPPGSSIHGILQAGYWSGLPFPSPGELPNPGIEPRSPALHAGALPSEPPGNWEFILLAFVCPKASVFLPKFLKDIFTGIAFSVHHIFPFSSLKMQFLSLFL